MKELSHDDVEFLAETRDYIRKKYKNEENDEEEFIMEKIIDILEEVINFYAYEMFNCCSCCDENFVLIAIRNYLEIINSSHPKNKKSDIKEASKFRRKMYKKIFNCENVAQDPLLLYLAYNMDAIGITEHGCSIAFAWLTEDGRRALRVLRIYLKYINYLCKDCQEEAKEKCNKKCDYWKLCKGIDKFACDEIFTYQEE